MQLFITGTDTNIGKTLICSWLCLQTGYSYCKPIQTGTDSEQDAATVVILSGSTVYPEQYSFKAPLSPHLASALENQVIEMTTIQLPDSPDLIVEGAGGLLVPLNQSDCLIDFIQYLKIPVILVASSQLGTINHTLLSLEALKNRSIPTLGVIMNGPVNPDNCHAITFYGKTTVLAQVPVIAPMTQENLKKIPLTTALQALLSRSP
ncbi:dethiobiotin synthase [unidentified bacterial endosymbiont]|uniref:dethiobiotin synthase n=1 Tax=unidentified bacterial endosymbiont TaxID=2355 RepID=UPI00209E55C2|nr:dethiobiotin synthase [unidentified bacterial endosymbiont]